MRTSDIKKMREFHSKPHNCGTYDAEYPERQIWFFDDVKCDVIKSLDALEKLMN